MRSNVKLECIIVPNKGSFVVGNTYIGFDHWYNADAGETEMVITDDNNNLQKFRDYEWYKYFRETN